MGDGSKTKSLPGIVPALCTKTLLFRTTQETRAETMSNAETYFCCRFLPVANRKYSSELSSYEAVIPTERHLSCLLPKGSGGFTKFTPSRVKEGELEVRWRGAGGSVGNPKRRSDSRKAREWRRGRGGRGSEQAFLRRTRGRNN